MRFSPFTLLTDRDRFWKAAGDGMVKWKDVLPPMAFIVLSCGLYGMVMAGWRSWELSFYVAIKLPALFLATTGIVSLFNWMLACLLGAGLNYRSTLLLAISSMTLAGWILLSLIPVTLMFVLSGVSSSGSHDELRYAHNSILVTHIVILAIAGVAGNVALYGGLKRLVPSRNVAGPLFVSWLTVFAFVGCQMAWILRPFVGSPFYDVVFLRPDCLNRNFYEFVFREVLPYLVNGG